jgi:hypothetical protein
MLPSAEAGILSDFLLTVNRRKYGVLLQITDPNEFLPKKTLPDLPSETATKRANEAMSSHSHALYPAT